MVSETLINDPNFNFVMTQKNCFVVLRQMCALNILDQSYTMKACKKVSNVVVERWVLITRLESHWYKASFVVTHLTYDFTKFKHVRKLTEKLLCQLI